MIRDDRVQLIIDVVDDRFGVVLDASSSLQDAFDSLDLLEVLGSLEDAHDLCVPESAMDPAVFRTVGTLADALVLGPAS